MMKVCTQCKHPGCVSMMLLSLRCLDSQLDDSPVPGSSQSDSEWELSCWASQWNPSWKQQHIPYYYFTIHNNNPYQHGAQHKSLFTQQPCMGSSFTLGV